MFYAQLDENSICIGIMQTDEVLEYPNIIEIPELDASCKGKRYENGQWIVSPLSELDQLKAEQETLKQSIAELTILLAGGA